jgi:hypothetical protein
MAYCVLCTPSLTGNFSQLGLVCIKNVNLSESNQWCSYLGLCVYVIRVRLISHLKCLTTKFGQGLTIRYVATNKKL